MKIRIFLKQANLLMRRCPLFTVHNFPKIYQFKTIVFDYIIIRRKKEPRKSVDKKTKTERKII